MQKVSIFSDGACSGNPGPGGWAAILKCDALQAEKVISGGVPATTNNKMELLAVINAVELLKVPCEITVYTDSRYVCDAFLKKWTVNWQRNGWKTADRRDVKNKDLWLRLLSSLAPHQVSWVWVKGHARHPENERCDALAVRERELIAENGQKY